MGKCEVDRVCEILLDKIIFMVIDESEISGCKYLNTLVGDIEVPETTYLLHCKILCTSSNQQTIAVDDAIRTLQSINQFSGPAYPWGVAGAAAQVGASKHLDPLQQRIDALLGCQGETN